MASIAPETPGWGTYHVFPQLGQLTTVSAVVPSVRGTISVSDTLSSSQFVMHSVSPLSTKAIVGIPKRSAWALVTANGQTIWSNGNFVSGVSGITGNSSDSSFITFTINPGTWVFKAQVSSAMNGTIRMTSTSCSRPVEFGAVRLGITVRVTSGTRYSVKVFDISGKCVKSYTRTSSALITIPLHILK